MDAVLDVVVEDERWSVLGDPDAFALRALEAVQAVARVPDGVEIAVLLADDAAIRALNASWRAQDKPTNVLSFPADAPPGLPAPRPLGDIVVAYETVAREAQAEGKTLADHATHLLIHGLLHLLGHDHETDDEAEAMEALEIEALARIGVANPYADVAA